MKYILLALFMLAASLVQCQSPDEFTLVDSYKIEKTKTLVFFNDPLKELVKKYYDFDNRPDREKHELLDEYLHTHILYRFQTTGKDGTTKTYELKGDPRKIRTKYIFNLDIISPSGSVEKVIDKTNIGGTFFEHMILFQTALGKEVVGKGVQIWGYFVFVEPYKNIKEKITAFIKMDAENAIPDDLIFKEKAAILPLFEYQKCGLQVVKSRKMVITVYQYDSTGKIRNKYPREETDKDLYLSSTSEEITAVTSFPFFSASDTIHKDGDTVSVNCTLSNINHYLKDVRVIMSAGSNQVSRIEGTLLIHGYSAKGHSINEERYIAEFEKTGECYLPRHIKFCRQNDINYSEPRLTIDITYDLK